MVRTLRNQNKCTDCGYTWYPRGKDRSRACPDCGSGNVRVVSQGAPALLGFILIGVVVAVARCGKDEPKTASQDLPAQIGAEAGSAKSAELASKREFIEPSRPELVRKETEEVASTSVREAAPASDALSASSPVTDGDRVYSDDEIRRMEDEKQYQGDDPIVRSRLGLPSRETRKLIK